MTDQSLTSVGLRAEALSPSRAEDAPSREDGLRINWPVVAVLVYCASCWLAVLAIFGALT